MAQTASLALLKGMTNKAPIEEPEQGDVAAMAAEEAEVAEDTVVVDVDKMSSKDLDALVQEHGVTVPDGWSAWAVLKKRAWLKTQFEEAPAEETAEETESIESGTHVAFSPEAKEDEPLLIETMMQEALPEGMEVVPSLTATPTKPKPKTQAALVKKVAGGEVLPPELLTDTVHEIENLGQKEARALVGVLADQADFTYFKLGGVLSLIQAKGWFQPHTSFRDFVENEHGIAYRRAMYYVTIYNNLSEANIPWEKVKSIGWTKMVELAEILTLENVDEWVQIAGNQTVLQLQASVKAAKSQGGTLSPLTLEGQGVVGSQVPVITTKTFKVHADQKLNIDAALAKAKEIGATPYETQALELICLEYMGTPKQIPLADRLKHDGIDACLKAFEEAFPDVTINVELPEAAAAE